MYFAGDTSDDTRLLIEALFASDPEFGRMADRFRTLMAERLSTGATEADRAKIVFDRTRVRVKLRLAAMIWTLGAVFPLAMAAVVPLNGRFIPLHPGVVIGVVFAIAALAMWLMSFSPHPENWYSAFTGRPPAGPSST
jgi:hypothetical protein